MLTGNIGSGFGVAGRNLSPVEILICKRIGFKSVVHGTLNVRLNEPYFIKPNALIEVHEYKINNEKILLQRCRIRGLRGVITRPDSHERGYAHGPSHIEIMGEHHFRNVLNLKDNDIVQVEVEGNEEWWNSPEVTV